MTVNILSGCVPTAPPTTTITTTTNTAYDTTYDVIISRTAAMFARVFQPSPALAAALRGQRTRLTTGQHALRATSSGGIVYVKWPDRLVKAESPLVVQLVTSPQTAEEEEPDTGNATERNSTLRSANGGHFAVTEEGESAKSEGYTDSTIITENGTDFDTDVATDVGTDVTTDVGTDAGHNEPHIIAPVNITIRVWLSENDTCQESGGTMCAFRYQADDCEATCGVGANGNCTWRPPEGNNVMTSEYGTCSSDLATCPDGTCDELEQLSGPLCPQDCAGQPGGGHGCTVEGKSKWHHQVFQNSFLLKR